MEPTVLLKGARVALDGGRAERIDLRIRGTRFLPFDDSSPPTTELDLSGLLLLPGLINSHDHLEFNLFPRLGGGFWPNAREWAAAVYRPDCSPVKEHRAVPRDVRLVWGGIKNLLSGVTTVAHHNPWEAVFDTGFPVRVVRDYGWAHSLDFTADLLERYDETPRDSPFILHAAEGTDACARTEISRLDDLGILDRRTVLVHAVGISPRQLATIRGWGAWVVWCPSSNLFTLGATLPAQVIREGVHLMLGTDSALTAEGDMVDEIRVAQQQGSSARALYPMVTTNAACALRLTEGEGAIRENGIADVIAVKDTGQSPADALSDLHCELVFLGGQIMLMSRWLARRFRSRDLTEGLEPLEVEERGKWLIRADIRQLYSSAAAVLGEHFRLAGRKVAL